MSTENLRNREPAYLTLPEAARRLGLGLRRQTRKNPKYSVSEIERLARPVRKLIRENKLKAVYDTGGYLVREDWIEEYEARREIAAKWKS